MLNYNEFLLFEAEINPAIAALETQIKDKLTQIPDIKKTAKVGKKGADAKVASLKLQAKAHSEISALMLKLSAEISRQPAGEDVSTNIY